MNTIHILNKDNFEEVKKLHSQFFDKDFKLPEFGDSLFGCVVQKDQEVISCGFIRHIPELIMVTNLNASLRDRRDAMMTVLEANVFASARFGHHNLTAVVNDDRFYEILKKLKFEDVKGKALILEF